MWKRNMQYELISKWNMLEPLKKIEDPHSSGKKRFYILFSQIFSATKTTFNGNIFIIYCFCKYSKMKRLNIACGLSKIHSPDKTSRVYCINSSFSFKAYKNIYAKAY